MVMKNLFRRFRAWRERRQQKNREWWKRKRAKGIFRYVLWFTVTFGGLMIIVSSLIDYWDYHKLRVQRFTIIYYPVFGILIGLIAWWANERKYH
jgi:hypothetical protein